MFSQIISRAGVCQKKGKMQRERKSGRQSSKANLEFGKKPLSLGEMGVEKLRNVRPSGPIERNRGQERGREDV